VYVPLAYDGFGFAAFVLSLGKKELDPICSFRLDLVINDRIPPWERLAHLGDIEEVMSSIRCQSVRSIFWSGSASIEIN
jgi:hypothetical protein